MDRRPLSHLYILERGTTPTESVLGRDMFFCKKTYNILVLSAHPLTITKRTQSNTHKAPTKQPTTTLHDAVHHHRRSSRLTRTASLSPRLWPPPQPHDRPGHCRQARRGQVPDDPLPRGRPAAPPVAHGHAVCTRRRQALPRHGAAGDDARPQERGPRLQGTARAEGRQPV